MDPQELAKQIKREALAQVENEADQGRLAEKVLNLLEWLERGGFAPDWKAL